MTTTRSLMRIIVALTLVGLPAVALTPSASAGPNCTKVTNGLYVCSITGAECLVLGNPGADSWTCAGPGGVCQRTFHSVPSWGWDDLCVFTLSGTNLQVICHESYNPTTSKTCVIG